jgi:hypothetical protein
MSEDGGMLVLTPAARIPWTVSSPFRMQPGLQRLPAAPPLFLRDALADAYAEARRGLLRAQAPLALVGRADPAVLGAIAQAYAHQTGVALPAEAQALALGMQEDFVVLRDEPDGMRTRLLAVCFPSSWNPAEKLGLDFTAIHAPVADNTLLQAGARGIVDMAFRQAPMLRHVWLLTPDGGLSQHPEAPRRRWDDVLSGPADTGLLERVFFRVERQTTLPLPALGHGVFFIRVMVCPLAQVLRVAPGRAGELHAALSSMSDAVVAYRGMGAARARLLDALRATA